jgi:hypothetical protein
MQTQERQGHRALKDRKLRQPRKYVPIQLEHELLTLINKKVVTLGSYWHSKDLIGVGLWFIARWNRGSSKDKQTQ